MPNKALNPRGYPEAKLVRQTEPYHFQRKRHRPGEFPRAPQANTYQPNQKYPRPNWMQGTADYWRGIYESYIRRKS